MLDRKIKILSVNEINVVLVANLHKMPFSLTGLLINTETENIIYLNAYTLPRDFQILISESPIKMLYYFKDWLVYTFDFDFKGYRLEYHESLFGISTVF